VKEEASPSSNVVETSHQLDSLVEFRLKDAPFEVLPCASLTERHVGSAEGERKSMKAAFLAFESCATWQVDLLLQILRMEGWKIDTLSLSGNPVQTSSGLILQPFTSIAEAKPRDYHFVLMAGGDIDAEALESAQFHRFLRQYDATGQYIGASCSSCLYLAHAGLLGGMKFTALEDTVREHEAAFSSASYTNEEVCSDGNYVTSKGHAHCDFAIAVCNRILPAENQTARTKLLRKLSKND